MSLDPDPDAPPTTNRTLWIGLTALGAALVLAAIAVNRVVPGTSSGKPSTQATPSPPSGSPSPTSPPLMTRPQLLENQQAMPELADFDSQNPPQNPINGNPVLGNPGASLGNPGAGLGP
ncbi:MAG: hypothetical protein VKK99_06270 [Cyanobacteriota bacterium]|nr:hypothetical protein [Cyanobacteriota bacterium]